MSDPKRRKTTSTCWECANQPNTRSIVYTLETLPPEVMEMVFKFLPLKIVSTSIRLVSRQCLIVATSILNSAFFSAGNRLETVINQTNLKITTVKDRKILLAYTRTFNILESIRAQYKMLRAVTWRYTHPPRPEKFRRLSFYAGSILDKLNAILSKATTQPAPYLGFEIENPSVVEFIGLCKRFMTCFEKVSERRLNRSALVSGCKAVDLLDCLAEGRQVLGFRLTTGRNNRGNVLCMKIRYVMRRSWFTCLQVPRAADENSWRDEQRFMYLRLRRLVTSVNEHYYEGVHYKREKILRIRATLLPSTYSGYGEYGGIFYFYGNMNKYAYANKFHKPLEPDELDDTNNDQNDIARQSAARVSTTFDVNVCIELRCSPELAPLALRSIIKSDDFENRSVSHNPEIYLKMKIHCPASINNRLPGHFTWELHAPRCARRTLVIS